MKIRGTRAQIEPHAELAKEERAAGSGEGWGQRDRRLLFLPGVSLGWDLRGRRVIFKNQVGFRRLRA